jgi:hypothetical protein
MKPSSALSSKLGVNTKYRSATKTKGASRLGTVTANLAAKHAARKMALKANPSTRGAMMGSPIMKSTMASMKSTKSSAPKVTARPTMQKKQVVASPAKTAKNPMTWAQGLMKKKTSPSVSIPRSMPQIPNKGMPRGSYKID